ncbi:MAG TPA: TetR/AcrR family transcriptional regulator [Kofleriaceae bacterium]|jgi:TetR/AcrR family transcriptional repressor of lmrAB and yxaGH operons|nr:TetR/AcrR family transcriptional regulator [Kofleriaceae bacterium]
MTNDLTKGERSRKKLVDTTAALLRRQGYHATGLAQIVAESGAPRGSLYFYFPGGKDDLAIAALQASSDAWRTHLLAAIGNAPDLGAALDALVTALADELEASGWVHGCPVATVALESPSDPVRTMIADHFQGWLEFSVHMLVHFGIGREVAEEMSLVALSALEGALLLARVQRSRAPLLAVARALRRMAEPHLRPTTTTAATSSVTAAPTPAPRKKPAARRA